MYSGRQLEKHLHLRVCDYLRLQYPDVLFRTDLGGIKLTMGQAALVKRMQGGKRSWPDIFIAEPCRGFAGLFIELKNTQIFKVDGSLRKNEHVEEQARMLQSLAARGYLATFAVGFDEARSIIDEYLSERARAYVAN